MDNIFEHIEPLKRYKVEPEFDLKKWFKDNLHKVSSKLKLNLVNKSKHPNPKFATSGSSGMDLMANLTESVVIEPMTYKLIPTGIHFGIPKGFEIQVRSRSGIAAKNGVMVLNSPGTVDQDYTGEIKVILMNLGSEPFTVNDGDRIAQAVLVPVMTEHTVTLVAVNSLGFTERGDGGFGSTGKN